MEAENVRWLLKQLGACRESRAWMGTRSLARAYKDCQRGDWLMWFAPLVHTSPRDVALATVACVRTFALYRVPDEYASTAQVALDTVEMWGRWSEGAQDVPEKSIRHLSRELSGIIEYQPTPSGDGTIALCAVSAAVMTILSPIQGQDTAANIAIAECSELHGRSADMLSQVASTFRAHVTVEQLVCAAEERHAALRLSHRLHPYGALPASR